MISNKNSDFLIDSLWILEASSGLCIFEENYVDFTKEGISSDLVASFLSGILTFAGEAFADEIQYIQFSNRKIFFEFTKRVLFVIAISEKENNGYSQVKRMNNEIAIRFNKKYKNVISNDNWSHNITTFANFSEDLKEIVKREPLKEKFVQKCGFKKSCKRIEKFLSKTKTVCNNHKEKLEKLILNKRK